MGAGVLALDAEAVKRSLDVSKELARGMIWAAEGHGLLRFDVQAAHIARARWPASNGGATEQQ